MAEGTNYAAYGLQTNRTSVEAGTKGDSTCFWCAAEVKGGFSLCFAHFVMCKHCADHAHDSDNDYRWKLVSQLQQEEDPHLIYCYKCRKKDFSGDTKLFESSAIMAGNHICQECVGWAQKTFKSWELIEGKSFGLVKEIRMGDYSGDNQTPRIIQFILKQCNLEPENYSDFVTSTLTRVMRIRKEAGICHDTIHQTVKLILGYGK